MKTLFLMILSLAFLSNVGFADSVDFDTPIDIEGTYSEPGVNQADQVKSYRQKLEAHNEMMMKKKIERMRLAQEIKLMKNIQNAFNQSMNNLDNIQ